MHFFKSIKERDPSYRGVLHTILFYPGVKALFLYRISHLFYKIHFHFLAALICSISRFLYSIEIHPGAIIGKNLFIDHGFGVVIGQTAVIGNNVTIYHGVTIGARSYTTKKRHPTIKDNVIIGCHAILLGNITIGENSKIGANATVTKDIPHNTVVKGPSAI